MWGKSLLASLTHTGILSGLASSYKAVSPRETAEQFWDLGIKNLGRSCPEDKVLLLSKKCRLVRSFFSRPDCHS